MFLPIGTVLYHQIHIKWLRMSWLKASCGILLKYKSRTCTGQHSSAWGHANAGTTLFVMCSFLYVPLLFFETKSMYMHIFVWIGVCFICENLNCLISTHPWRLKIFSHHIKHYTLHSSLCALASATPVFHIIPCQYPCMHCLLANSSCADDESGNPLYHAKV